MKLEVLSNEVEPRTEIEDGTEYVVTPIRFIRNMELHRGYVPEDEIREATLRWDGIEAISDHPRDESGKFVSVETEGIDKEVIGEIRDPQSVITNDTVTQGELWISTDDVTDIDDREVLRAIKNGETLSVSSAYTGEELPPGEYDGQYRENVRGNLKPDHVAVFASKEGRCSIEDGCFAGPQADISDGEVMVNVSSDSDSDSDDLDNNQSTSEESAEDEMTVSNGANESDSKTFKDRVVSVLESLGVKSTDMKRTETLVNEHGFDKENLPSEDTECFDQIYNRFVNEEVSSNATEQVSKSEQETQEVQSQETESVEEQTVQQKDIDIEETVQEEVQAQLGDQLQETVSEAVSQALSANQEREEKSDMVDTLIANSDSYGEDDREEMMDYPKRALSDLVANTETRSTNYSALNGASSNASITVEDDTDWDSMPSLVANERIGEMEDGE